MTIKDIAAHCGVSVSTVSRALNSRPDVSEQVRLRVLKAAQELRYVPNDTARELVRTGADAVGLVVRGVSNSFFAELFPSIEQSVEAKGFVLVPKQIKSGDDELRAGAALARSKRLKGLIFMGGRMDYSREELECLGIPFVCCSYTNAFGSLDAQQYSSVGIDDEAAAYTAVNMLIEKGHRRIAVLLSSRDDRSISELRYRGYIRALEEKGIEPDMSLVLEPGGYEMEAAYEAVDALCRSGADFSALFSISDSQAIAAVKALNDRGRPVPGSCSLCSIDGIETGKYTLPALTTIVQPKEELGRRSVELLMELISGSSGHRQVVLEPSLRQGGSVRDINT